jgi:hypothetical protein
VPYMKWCVKRVSDGVPSALAGGREPHCWNAKYIFLLVDMAHKGAKWHKP